MSLTADLRTLIRDDLGDSNLEPARERLAMAMDAGAVIVFSDEPDAAQRIESLERKNNALAIYAADLDKRLELAQKGLPAAPVQLTTPEQPKRGWFRRRKG
ncbi:hypothetical protein CJ179_38835 [Rhodococcus sp. ACS1]|uniref:hypothetical protein n=1 Tax=Rhodococcus sp. ACS1 TaxID=2028570 RepID=UPI000BB15D38|nr:hypothetical protein [Rhodococcus sp. ACS1]PBC38555.1 hypothetical protein CJ179_38835 [Rhodococcus sp. ACS1]